MSVQTLKRLFTVDEYHQMGETGIFADDDRLELIQGEVLQVSPIGTRHASCVVRLNYLLTSKIGDRALVSIQNPVRLNQHTESQPDLMLLQRQPDFYSQNHPKPQDVLLLIEITDTSGDYDRQVEIPLYAQARISEVWLVDLNNQSIEIYLHPSNSGYTQVRQVGRNQTLSPQSFPDLILNVDDVIG